MNRNYALATYLLVMPALAAELDVKGARLGDDEQAVQRAMPFLVCTTLPERFKALGDRDCSLRSGSWDRTNPDNLPNYGGAALAGASAMLIDGHAYHYQFTFANGHFGAVVTAMTEKYGRPTSATDGEVQNQAGAKFPARTLTWQAGNSKLTAEERASRVDESRVTLQYVTPPPAVTERTRSSAAENAKRL